MPPPKLNFKFFGPAIKFQYHLSENPVRDIWNELLSFSSPYYLKEIIRPNCPNDSHFEHYINFVSMSFRQAFDYHEASKVCSYHTKPLFIYYSVLNLTRAYLADVNNPEFIKPISKHGLSTKHLNVKNNDFFNINICCHLNGIFGELCKKLNYIFPAKQDITVIDACRNTIELIRELVNLDEDSEIIPFQVGRYSDGKMILSMSYRYFQNRSDEILKKIQNVKSAFLADFSLIDKDKLIFEKKFMNVSEMEEKTAEILNKYFDHSYLHSDDQIIFMNLSEFQLKQICCYFMLSFLLSSLVRYYPDKLQEILYGNDLKYKHLYTEICFYIERLYPNYIFNLITNRQSKFVPSIPL